MDVMNVENILTGLVCSLRHVRARLPVQTFLFASSSYKEFRWILRLSVAKSFKIPLFHQKLFDEIG